MKRKSEFRAFGRRGRPKVFAAPATVTMPVRVAGSRAMGMPATRGFRFPVRPGEKKAIDTDTTTIQVNTTGSFTLLNGCVQGTDFGNRIGRKIQCKSIFVRGRVHPQGANEATAAGLLESPAQMGRMILLVDMQPNGATPAVTDLLKEAKPESQLNLNNRDRFKILADKQYGFAGFNKAFTAAGSESGSFAHSGLVKKYKRLNLETIFNSGNAGTVADINSGALYMFWIGSVATGVTDINASVSIRVRFIDP